MRSLVLLLLASVAGCAPQPITLPPGLRPDLGAEWLEGKGYRCTTGDGFAVEATFGVLPPDVLLDRFGPETGRFFSPREPGSRRARWRRSAPRSPSRPTA